MYKGARAAVLASQQSQSTIKTLVLVSYPMIGAQKGDSREQILLDLPENVDVLFISGSKDSMCPIKKLQEVIAAMKARSWLVVVESADHGMNVSPKTATQAMVRRTGALAAEWLKDRDEGKRHCSLSWISAERKVVRSDWQSDPIGTA